MGCSASQVLCRQYTTTITENSHIDSVKSLHQYRGMRNIESDTKVTPVVTMDDFISLQLCPNLSINSINEDIWTKPSTQQNTDFNVTEQMQKLKSNNSFDTKENLSFDFGLQNQSYLTDMKDKIVKLNIINDLLNDNYKNEFLDGSDNTSLLQNQKLANSIIHEVIDE